MKSNDAIVTKSRPPSTCLEKSVIKMSKSHQQAHTHQLEETMKGDEKRG